VRVYRILTLRCKSHRSMVDSNIIRSL
jgi:hypothetical protein